MIKKIWSGYIRLRDDKRFGSLIDMLNFIVLILVIHYLYEFFMVQFDFLIARIFGVYNWFNNTVYHQSKFFLKMAVPLKSEGQKFIFENKSYIDILFPCTGIQPILQFALVIFLYPGPWKHKFWFIPMGMLILHLTNVLRIVGLGVVMAYWPQHWNYAHDYPFRVILYLVLFILWLVWNDKFYRPQRKLKHDVNAQKATAKGHQTK